MIPPTPFSPIPENVAAEMRQRAWTKRDVQRLLVRLIRFEQRGGGLLVALAVNAALWGIIWRFGL